MTELTEASMKEYDAIRDQLMDDFIKNISTWVKWDELSGFEETMARSAIRILIIKSYHEGTMNGIKSMSDNLKEFQDDAMRDI